MDATCAAPALEFALNPASALHPTSIYTETKGYSAKYTPNASCLASRQPGQRLSQLDLAVLDVLALALVDFVVPVPEPAV